MSLTSSYRLLAANSPSVAAPSFTGSNVTPILAGCYSWPALSHSSPHPHADKTHDSESCRENRLTTQYLPSPVSTTPENDIFHEPTDTLTEPFPVDVVGMYMSPPPSGSQPKHQIPLPPEPWTWARLEKEGVLDSPPVLRCTTQYPLSPPPTVVTSTLALPPNDDDEDDNHDISPVDDGDDGELERNFDETCSLLSPLPPEWDGSTISDGFSAAGDRLQLSTLPSSRCDASCGFQAPPSPVYPPLSSADGDTMGHLWLPCEMFAEIPPRTEELKNFLDLSPGCAIHPNPNLETRTLPFEREPPNPLEPVGTPNRCSTETQCSFVCRYPRPMLQLLNIPHIYPDTPLSAVQNDSPGCSPEGHSHPTFMEPKNDLLPSLLSPASSTASSPSSYDLLWTPDLESGIPSPLSSLTLPHLALTHDDDIAISSPSPSRRSTSMLPPLISGDDLCSPSRHLLSLPGVEVDDELLPLFTPELPAEQYPLISYEKSNCLLLIDDSNDFPIPRSPSPEDFDMDFQLDGEVSPEFEQLCELSKRSNSLERAARQIEDQLTERGAIQARNEARRVRKQEKEKGKEIGALLRLKLGRETAATALDAEWGSGCSAKKAITHLPQLVARMIFRRRESCRPLANRRIPVQATFVYTPSSLSTVIWAEDLE